MQVGAFNLGAIQGDGPTLDNMDMFTPTGFTSHQNDGLSQLGLTSNTGLTSIILNRGNRPTRIHQAYSLRRTWFSYYSGSAWAYHEAYTTGNTTKSSDGTLKAASPVARIVVSQEACQRADIRDSGQHHDCCITFRLRSFRFATSNRLSPSGSSPATLCYAPGCLSSSGGQERRCRDPSGRLALPSRKPCPLPQPLRVQLSRSSRSTLSPGIWLTVCCTLLASFVASTRRSAAATVAAALSSVRCWSAFASALLVPRIWPRPKAPAMAEMTSAASPIIVSIPTFTSHQNGFSQVKQRAAFIQPVSAAIDKKRHALHVAGMKQATARRIEPCS